MFKLFKGIITTTANAKESLENDLLIIDKTWLLIDQSGTKKTTYIFWSKNNELIISESGNVKRGKWFNIKGSNKLLLEVDGNSKLYLILYLREHYFVFKNDFDPGLFVCINESYYTNLYTKHGAKLLDLILKESGNFQTSATASVVQSIPSSANEIGIVAEKGKSDSKKQNDDSTAKTQNSPQFKPPTKSDGPPTELDKHIEAMYKYLSKK